MGDREEKEGSPSKRVKLSHPTSSRMFSQQEGVGAGSGTGSGDGSGDEVRGRDSGGGSDDSGEGSSQQHATASEQTTHPIIENQPEQEQEQEHEQMQQPAPAPEPEPEEEEGGPSEPRTENSRESTGDVEQRRGRGNPPNSPETDAVMDDEAMDADDQSDD
ncbi:hypothetical protein SLS62_007202 [Diatrype stigma]|uniref:Uncharacterized protein n=1 Tax=Diatrype stigma TaxID=117547 RepID=A0AAN9UZM9_9PEZI